MPDLVVATAVRRTAGPFRTVLIAQRFAFGTLIEWLLDPAFREPGPYVFQLQVGRAGNDDNWQDVGGPLIDALGVTVSDAVQRLWAFAGDVWYRVQLQTAEHAYTSSPYRAGNILALRDRAAAGIIVRQHLRWGRFGGLRGKFLKRRIFGTPCPGQDDPLRPGAFIACRDWDTGTVMNSDCGSCFGTGILGGYYPAVSADLIPIVLSPSRLTREAERGTTDEITRRGRLPAWYGAATGDAWADCNDGKRYYVDSVEPIVEMRGVILIHQLELHLAPASDPLYRVDLAATDYGGYAGGYAEINT